MGRGESQSEPIADSIDSIARAESKKRTTSNLIPMGSKYMENGFNVLLVGEHGTGKTASVLDIAKSLGYKVKMFSGATMDPYTDLIGVPVPKEDENGSHLEMVRPRDLDEAEVIFFDEINRAPSATQNAVFEIIQFGTINGEPLPKLKCCWAAMNPDNGDYDVDSLDPALVDRFDAYQELKAKPSVPYMSKKMPKLIAQALYTWWVEQNQKKRGPENYISPRRLEKIGILYNTLGTKKAVIQALPPGGTYDKNKLIKLLESAKQGKSPLELEKTERVPAEVIFRKEVLRGGRMTRPKARKHSKAIIKYMKANPKDVKLQNDILKMMESGVGTKGFVETYGNIIANMAPVVVESWAKKSFIGNPKSVSEKTKRSQIKELLSTGKFYDASTIRDFRTSMDKRTRDKLFKMLFFYK